MNLSGEWKARLKPAGVMLAGYFFVPLLASWLMGDHNALFGGFTVSDMLQAGLGAALIPELLKLKAPLLAKLELWLGGRGQAPAGVKALSGRISAAATVLVPAALLLPPLGGLLPSGWLTGLLKLGVVAYAVYAGYAIWKLLEPYLAYVPPGEEAAARPEPPAAPEKRCPNCGQLIEDSMKVCAFCKQSLAKP